MPFRRARERSPAPLTALAVAALCCAPTSQANDFYLTSATYDPATVSNWILNNPGAPPGDHVVTLIFAPGTYVIDQLRQPWDTPAERELELRAEIPDNRPVLKFNVPITNPGYQGASPNNLFDGPAWQSWMLYFLGKNPLTRFEAHDLILDANWPAWALTKTGANPAYVSGFALGALRVQAPQGEISNVHIRNWGSNGITPGPYWSAAGRECFPLFIEATDFGAGYGTGVPAWLVEDCEVSDFHSLHGGYGTAIMATVWKNDLYDPAVFPFTEHRPVVIRRCQIRGNRNVIAFGSAAVGGNAAAGVTYSDNVVLNASKGLNHDTGPMRNFDFNNNILLDVGMLGNIGGAHWGASGFVNYTIRDNAIRLRGVPLNQDYRSYEWQQNTIGSFTTLMPVTDPTLPIGRFETSYSVGLKLAGTDQIAFENNRFTTRLMADFYEPVPGGGDANTARWTPVFRPTEDPSTHRTCTQTGSVDPSDGNTLSTRAMDFTTLTAISAEDLISASADRLPAINYPPSGFMPEGWSGRAGMVGSGGQLVTVEEIQIGRPELTPGGDVDFLARWVFHPTGASSTETWENHGGTTADALRLLVTDPAGNTSSPIPASPLGNWAEFTFSPTAGPGRYYLVVFNASNGAPFDPDGSVWSWAEYLHGTTVRLERAPDVADDRRFSPGTLRITRSGSTSAALEVLFDRVTMGTGIVRSVNPDKDYTLRYASNGAPISYNGGPYSVTIPLGQKEVLLEVVPLDDSDGEPDVAEYEVAYFRLVEHSGYAIAPPGADTTAVPGTDIVAVTFWDGPKYRLFPLDHIEYGGGASMAGVMESGLATEEAIATDPAMLLETYPPDQGPVGLDAVVSGWPGPDEEALAAQLIAEGADPGPILDWWHPDVQAVMGIPLIPAMDRLGATELVTVTFEDGTLLSGQAALYTFAYGINNFGAGGSPMPKISGWAYMGPTTRPAGWWQAPVYDQLNPVAQTTWFCILYGVDETGDLVGNDGSNACYYDAASGILQVLLDPLMNNAVGRGNALSPNGSYAAGYSYYSINGYSFTRPVRWYRSGSAWLPAEDLGSTDGILWRTAYAEDVKDDGVAVGRTYYPPSPGGYRAFRTPPAPGKITGPDDLLPLVHAQTNSPPLLHNAAYGINAGGEVVGSSDTHYKRGGTWVVEKRAAFWKSTAGSEGFTLGVLQPDLGGGSTLNPGQSEAWAVNQRQYGATVVGTGWATPTGEDRAFVCEVSFQVSGGTPSIAKMLNLNDPHLTVIDESGWVLRKAEDINDAGWIVGTGYLNGPTHGFLLVPQTVSSQ